MMRSILLALGLSVLSVGGALAQSVCQPQAGCACVAAVVPGMSPGQLTNVVGDVKVAGPASFSPATTPFGLNNGYDILVGPGGQATVNFGPACQGVSLQTSAHVTVSGSCACLRVDPPGSPPPRGAAAGATILFGIGVAGFLLHKEEPQVSP
jgi:hypothetical protein